MAYQQGHQQQYPPQQGYPPQQQYQQPQQQYYAQPPPTQTPCAAGDIAVEAGRSYLCSCCIAPTLSHFFHHDQSWIEACAWSMDRVALANRYGINDPLEQGTCFSMAYIFFACGCAACLLFQELNHIKAVKMGLAPGPQGSIPIQKVMTM